MDEDRKACIQLAVLQLLGGMARSRLDDPNLSEKYRIHFEEMAARADRMMAEIESKLKPLERPSRLRRNPTRADFDPSLNYGA
jgi:hypothetical protein